MFDIARQLHFTHSLQRFSEPLDDLLFRAQQSSPHLPPELIDEIALTTGELMLVLMNHSSFLKEEAVHEALAHAKRLREHLRINERERDRVTEECLDFSREIARLVSESKKAA
jgi:hypothetical protein